MSLHWEPEVLGMTFGHRQADDGDPVACYSRSEHSWVWKIEDGNLVMSGELNSPPAAGRSREPEIRWILEAMLGAL